MILKQQVPPSSLSPNAVSPRAHRTLQRKCACGGTPGPTDECAECKRKRLSVQTKLAVNQPGDRYEQEADRVAAAVVGGAGPRRLSISSLGNGAVQREGPPKPKSDEEKYKEAAKKVGEAFLETPPGKEITKKAEELGDAFISTLPGKIITGAAVTGAVAALAATHKELPIGIPEIPLDKIRPGLKMKLTYEGPVDKPTRVVATFSIPLGKERARENKPALSESEKFQAETARMAADQAKFREGLKSDEEKASEQAMINAYVSSRMLAPDQLTPRTSPLSFGAVGQDPAFRPGAPAVGPRRSSLGPWVPDFQLSGETSEEPKKKEEGTLQRKAASHEETGSAPAIVDQVLQSSGEPLDRATRVFMEQRFGFDFSQVRIHADQRAAQSARAVGAQAYTVGRQIAFDTSRYAPGTQAGRELLAHELTHVVQQGGTASPSLQRKPGDPPVPRKDYVFLMGEDRAGTGNPFYQTALRFYKAHMPQATFVTDQRSLADLLDYLKSNVAQPIGNLYLVSHANEDGTLSFGLNAADANAHVSVVELRDAIRPGGGGKSTLADVSSLVDRQTKIHIKGCDIGRTQEMVELIDEAFGGAGVVTAPTHEQGYGNDPTLAAAESTRVTAERVAAFTKTLPPIPPEPAKVDPTLKGDEKVTAQKERAAAVAARAKIIAERDQAIAQERLRVAPEATQAGEVAGTYESFSGPMFQRPGTTLYKAEEIAPEVKKLYGHLSETQQADLVRRLVASDARTGTVADQQGTFQQRGQRVYRKKPFSVSYTEPRDLKEASVAFHQQFLDSNFTPKKFRPPTTTGAQMIFVTEGRFAPPDKEPFDSTLSMTVDIPSDATILTEGKKLVSNPDRYAWQVERLHASNGTTTAKAVAERVLAYLHHGSLDPSAHEHFTRPESDPNFFATSTFAPPLPPAKP